MSLGQYALLEAHLFEVMKGRVHVTNSQCVSQTMKQIMDSITQYMKLRKNNKYGRTMLEYQSIK